MRFYSHLNSARTILDEFDGSIPFAAWLKQYFKSHKKFGSRDRKVVSDLCYCYFRLGKMFKERPVEERLITAQFLCHGDSGLIKEIKPEWTVQLFKSIHDKLDFLAADAKLIFPFTEELSSEIGKEEFAQSHLIQPDLFLRVRPNKKEVVLKKLEAVSFQYSLEGDCIRLANSSKIDGIIELDKEAVVQDISSQQVLDPLKAIWERQSFTSWDCCAASGGKTILLHDQYPQAQLSVSDIRETILHNLKNRFRRAGIHQFQSFVADISSPSYHSNKKYDVIICDAPCSGSGTWGRTPEQLSFFTKDKIDHYAKLQKSIAVNASKNLKQGGAFVYITCSVFTKENEDVVTDILQNSSLVLSSQQYFKGYTEKADTLFAAVFTL